MGFLDFIKRKNNSNTSISSTDKDLGFKIVAQPNEYELDDVTFIREIQHIKCGAWEQYDVLLAACPYGWENMKAWAEYVSKNDLDLSHGTLSVARMVGTNAIELIEQYHSVGDIQKIPELETEQGVLAMGGASQKLHAPVKIVWMNQTRCLRFFTLVSDKILIRRYIETVIRRTFGTPNEMKLAKPIPEEQ